MRWTIHSERTLYQDPWVHLASADVELPDGRHLDHRLIRTAAPGAGLAIIINEKVLLIWRHRFITDTWGWEIPQGSIRPDETPPAAAVREAQEETGWRAEGPITPLLYVQPSPGLLTSEHHIYTATHAQHLGAPEDHHESQSVNWIALTEIPHLIAKRDIVAGTTVAALCLLLHTRTK
ncbi:ADP-ribose pyrophosphatase YjhB (NUDIX family) [Micromonospora sp. M71_S20]|uniref:NUDIX hydrolase n=1 Tax=Micromonospora sp. M71_S20 TaxID=592872 RepID=UPI000EAF7D8C|nr:NUDIX hydrolase [Micromonospora sp. M71_S20]RLK09480.1 ADP-ribose pyrophosphatase YjhB (NUDIX family) [Micromonospora sp. M71_S20]